MSSVFVNVIDVPFVVLDSVTLSFFVPKKSLLQKLRKVERLSTPTLMIQGASDNCDAPKESEDQDAFFTGGYQRLLLEGVGHFPHREAPEIVADALIDFLSKLANG